MGVPAEQSRVTAHEDRKEKRQQSLQKEKIMPISELQAIEKEDMEEPLQLLFKGRINDMSVAEKEAMQQMKVTKGHSQRADFVPPTSVHIVRCPIASCRAPINTHGIERSIKTHLNASHPEVKSPVIATVLKFNQAHPVKYYYPSPSTKGNHGSQSCSQGQSQVLSQQHSQMTEEPEAKEV